MATHTNLLIRGSFDEWAINWVLLFLGTHRVARLPRPFSSSGSTGAISNIFLHFQKRLSWAVVELRPHQNQPGEKPAWGKLPSWKECLKWLCIVVTIWCQWHRGECPTGRKPRGKSSRLNVKCSPRMFNIVARPMGKTADMDGDERDFYGRSMNQFHTMSTSAAGFFLYIKVSKIEIVSITRRFLEPKLSVPNEDHRRRSPHPVHQPGYQECECSMFG